MKSILIAQKCLKALNDEWWPFLRYKVANNFFIWAKVIRQSLSLGTSINDVLRFWAIFDLPTYQIRQFLSYNVRYLEAFLDPPTYPKIGRYLWTLPLSTERNASLTSILFSMLMFDRTKQLTLEIPLIDRFIDNLFSWPKKKIWEIYPFFESAQLTEIQKVHIFSEGHKT